MPTYESEEGYDLYAEKYRNDHEHLDSFDWSVAGVWWKQAFAECAQRLPRIAVLDAGCGDGRTLARWAKWVEKQQPSAQVEFFGVDTSQNMLRQAAKKSPNVRFSKLDLSDRCAVDRWVKAHSRVDLLSSFFVSVHFPQLEDFFEVHARFANPRAAFLMNLIPQRQPPVLQAGGKSFTIRAYHHNFEDALEAAETCGWKLIRQEQCFEKTELVSTLFWWEYSG